MTPHGPCQQKEWAWAPPSSHTQFWPWTRALCEDCVLRTGGASQPTPDSAVPGRAWQGGCAGFAAVTMEESLRTVSQIRIGRPTVLYNESAQQPLSRCHCQLLIPLFSLPFLFLSPCPLPPPLTLSDPYHTVMAAVPAFQVSIVPFLTILVDTPGGVREQHPSPPPLVVVSPKEGKHL